MIDTNYSINLKFEKYFFHPLDLWLNLVHNLVMIKYIINGGGCNYDNYSYA